MASFAMTTATDLDMLISKGYPEYESRWALKTTKGDLRAATKLLSSALIEPGGIESVKGTGWFGEQEDDWINYVAIDTINSAVSEQIRGLFKCPVYVRVANFRVAEIGGDECVLFLLNISLKDQRMWQIERRYSQFVDFKNKIPSNLVAKLAHFPYPRPTNRTRDSEFQERRRAALETWFRDLCLNEECCKSVELMDQLYVFIEIDNHGGRSTVMKGYNGVPLYNGGAGANRPFLFNPPISVDFKSVPALAMPLPVDVAAIAAILPVRIKIDAGLKALIQPPEMTSKAVSADKTMKQLTKDYGRDRVVIQGKRLLGSRTSIDEICEIMKNAIYFQLHNHNISQRFESVSVNNFAMQVLSSIGRTESAFATFALVNSTISAPGCILTPESALALPIEINFSIRERPTSVSEKMKLKQVDAAYLEFLRRGDLDISEAVSISSSGVDGDEVSVVGGGSSGGGSPNASASDGGGDDRPRSLSFPPSISTPLTPDINLYHVTNANPNQNDWCLVCEAQAMTVFRICDAETMKPILQVRVTYRQVLFGMPTCMNNAPTVSVNDFMIPMTSNIAWNLTVKGGESSIVIQKEKTTTSRDWNGDE